MTTYVQPSFDDALARVAHNADPEWMRETRRIVADLAAAGTFTVDDVWDRLDQLDGIGTPEPRALGAVITTAKRHSLIEHTGHYVKARRRRATVPVWKAGTAHAMTGGADGGPPSLPGDGGPPNP